MDRVAHLFQNSIEALFVEIIGGVGVVVLIFFLFGIPSHVFRSIRAFFSSRRLEKKLSQGPFDNGTISRAIKYYVRPMCSNADPSVEEEPLQAISKVREPLFKFLDRYLSHSDGRRKYLLLLADSGMGKTSFFINYFHYRNRYLSRRKNVCLVSLAQSDCMQHISRIDRKESIDLFLDALDEDVAAYGRVVERITELLKHSELFRSVIISCRTQFFVDDDEIPSDTGLFVMAPVAAGESKKYTFQKIYLSPFDDSQIHAYLRRRYPGPFHSSDRARAFALVKQVPALSVRPMLLAHMPEIVSSRVPVTTSADVYSAMVDAWLLRESSWIRPDDLRVFSCRLAVDFYVNKSSRGAESALPEEIGMLARSWGYNLDLGYLTSRSLLNRSSNGRYKFAHRSIMEFFVVESIFSGLKLNKSVLTDQMVLFLLQKVGFWCVEAKKFFTGKTVQVECINPVTHLGYATDYRLFHPVDLVLNMPSFMRVRVKSYMGKQVSKSLADALHHISDMANYYSIGGVRLSILRFKYDGINDVLCNATVWLRNGAILVAMTIDKNQLVDDWGADFFSLIRCGEAMVSIDGTTGNAEVAVRNNLRADEVLDFFNRPSRNSSSVSFSYGDECSLKISTHESFLSVDSSLCEYGLLGSVNVSIISNDAGLLLAPRAYGAEKVGHPRFLGA